MQEMVNWEPIILYTLDAEQSPTATSASFLTSPSSDEECLKPAAASSQSSFILNCKVCSGASSGFHYGVNTCEACKVFFRRSVGNEASIKPCKRDGKCTADNPKGKISCAECRHKKCLSVGMSKDNTLVGIRKGRYTNEKRSENTKELKLQQADACDIKSFEIQNCEETAKVLTKQFNYYFPRLQSYLNNARKLEERVNDALGEERIGKLLKGLVTSVGENPDHQFIARVDNLTQLFHGINLTEDNSSSAEEDFLQQLNIQLAMNALMEAGAIEMEEKVRTMVLFAKSLDGFSELSLEDQVILLKASRMEVNSICRHKLFRQDLQAYIYYSESDDLTVVPLQFMSRTVGVEFVERQRRASERMQKLKFNTEDMAVLLAFILLTPDREGLHRSDQVQKLQDRMLPVLQFTLMKNHPDNPNILAETLLLLPQLREDDAVATRTSLIKLRAQIRPEITPLLAEIVHI